MDWRLKVATQAVLNRVPFGQALRRLKRRHFGYEPDDANLRETLVHLGQMKAALEAQGRSFEGATVLEIGSGWFPTIPIMLSLGGAKQVLMSDLNRHMDEVTFAATLRFLKRVQPSNPDLEAIGALTDLPIRYLAPFDLDDIPDRSLDLVVSRTVFEHIPPNDLARLLRGLRPKVAAGGLMVHLIDHSDHLEHVDKGISKINFLTWSRSKHALVNFLMRDGENRMRHHEYQGLFEAAGFDVLSASAQIHPPTRDLAKTLPLAAPFASFSPDQLAALSSIYVLAPRPNAPA
jgi:SAM-dependent methyltransferase